MKLFSDLPKLREKITFLVVAGLAGMVILTPVGSILGRQALATVLVPLLLIAYARRGQLTTAHYALLTGFTAAAALVFAGSTALIMRDNINRPAEWDFYKFWLNGQVIAAGDDFYESEPYRREFAAAHLEASAEFYREEVEIGSLYPPPSMMMFIPLGWFDRIEDALVLWDTILVSFLVAGIVLLWRVFLPESGLLGLALAGALVMMLYSVEFTLRLTQTNTVLLVCTLFYWRQRHQISGGVWLAVGVFIKPFLVFVGLFVLLRRQWRVVAGGVAAVGVLFALSIVAFGPSTVGNYFTHNQSNKVVDTRYTEAVNQSLLATILRLTDADFEGETAVFNPLYLCGALLLVGTSAWLIWKQPAENFDWAIALCLPLALLVYPPSLTHYRVILLIPLFLIWQRRAEFSGRLVGAVGVITLTYLLIGLDNAGVFVATLMLWLALAVVMLPAALERKRVDGSTIFASA